MRLHVELLQHSYIVICFHYAAKTTTADWETANDHSIDFMEWSHSSRVKSAAVNRGLSVPNLKMSDLVMHSIWEKFSHSLWCVGWPTRLPAHFTCKTAESLLTACVISLSSNHCRSFPRAEVNGSSFLSQKCVLLLLSSILRGGGSQTTVLF